MAYYLSEVTHERLKDRLDEPPSHQERGIVLTHQFTGQIRCVEIASGTLPDFTIWTGDIDGGITIRKGLVGKPIATIPRKPDVFVYAMARYGNNMWVGYSDGWISIFDIKARKVIQEMKGHCGAVNCMLVINEYLFSGGNDWQIVQWDPIQMARRTAPYGQLSGHQNAVRCFTTDGTYLYSGGDDYSIRCWDLDTTYERMAPWPIISHGDSVRAICVHEVYLFSSSMDGTVKVWNTQTAQIVRELDSEQFAVNTLALDSSGGRLWCGTTGGVIRIWDAVTLVPIADLHEHHETHVPLVKTIARLNAVKAWTLGPDQKLRIWYSDNEANEIEFQQLADMENSLQDLIEGCRKQIIVNYQELERCKIEVKELEEADRSRKVAIAKVFGEQRQAFQKGKALELSLLWNTKARLAEQQRRICTRMEFDANANILRRYFEYLRQSAHHHKGVRRKAAVARILQVRHENAITRVYVHNLQEAVRREKNTAHRLVVANAFGRLFGNQLRRMAYVAWRRFLRARKEARKRQAVGLAVRGEVSHSILEVYWGKLARFVRTERLQQTVADHMKARCDLNQRDLLARYFGYLRMNALTRTFDRQRSAASKTLVLVYDRDRLAEFYHKWLTLMRRNRVSSASARLQQQKDQIGDMERALQMSASMTEQELEALLRQRQKHLTEVLAENVELDDEIEYLLHKKKALGRELMKDVSIDTTKPKIDQLMEAMHFLKARGVNTFSDAAEIAAARDLAKSSSAEAVYEEGIAEVRRVCAKLVKPAKLVEKGESDWYVGDMWTHVTEKIVSKAMIGIVHFVTAFDMLNVGQVDAWLSKDNNGVLQWNAKHQHNEEVLSNFGTLLEFAVRQYRTRRGEDPLTGEALSDLPEKKTRRVSSFTAGKLDDAANKNLLLAAKLHRQSTGASASSGVSSRRVSHVALESGAPVKKRKVLKKKKASPAKSPSPPGATTAAAASPAKKKKKIIKKKKKAAASTAAGDNPAPAGAEGADGSAPAAAPKKKKRVLKKKKKVSSDAKTPAKASTAKPRATAPSGVGAKKKTVVPKRTAAAPAPASARAASSGTPGRTTSPQRVARTATPPKASTSPQRSVSPTKTSPARSVSPPKESPKSGVAAAETAPKSPPRSTSPTAPTTAATKSPPRSTSPTAPPAEAAPKSPRSASSTSTSAAAAPKSPPRSTSPTTALVEAAPKSPRTTSPTPPTVAAPKSPPRSTSPTAAPAETAPKSPRSTSPTALTAPKSPPRSSSPTAATAEGAPKSPRAEPQAPPRSQSPTASPAAEAEQDEAPPLARSPTSSPRARPTE